MSYSCFIHSSINAYLGSFHILVIINNAAIHIGVLMFFQISALASFRYIPRSEITGQKSRSISNFMVTDFRIWTLLNIFFRILIVMCLSVAFFFFIILGIILFYNKSLKNDSNSIMSVSNSWPDLNLITSQKFQLQTPLRWELAIQHMNWRLGESQTFSPKQRGRQPMAEPTHPSCQGQKRKYFTFTLPTHRSVSFYLWLNALICQ